MHNLKHPCAETCSGYTQAADEATLVLRAQLTVILSERDSLKAALETISQDGFGLDITDDEVTRATYWSQEALRHRRIARAALEKK